MGRVCTAALSLLLLLAPLSASAATYVFDITVDSRRVDGVPVPFAPVHFSQTWISGIVYSTLVVEPRPSGTLEQLSGLAALFPSETPLDAETFAVSGLSPSDLNGAQFSGTATRFDGATSGLGYDLFFSHFGSIFDSPAANVTRIRSWSMGLGLSASGPAAPHLTAFTDPYLAALMMGKTLTFGVEGGMNQFNSVTRERSFSQVKYTGTAVLTSFDIMPQQVPEPASWALMILGFAAVGSAARRRRVGA